MHFIKKKFALSGGKKYQNQHFLAEVYIILTVLILSWIEFILPLISHGAANILSGVADIASKAAKICQHGQHGAQCNQNGESDGADSSFLAILGAKKHFPTLQKSHTFS